MNRKEDIAAKAVLALLLVAVVSAASYSQHKSQDKSGVTSAQPGPTPNKEFQGKGQGQIISDIVISPEEKLVRNAYTRLMRYQSAALEERAARRGTSTKAETYIVFELRNIRTGPIEEIYDRPLSEMITGSGANKVRVRPNHLVHGNGPPHAYYETEWALGRSNEDIDQTTAGELLRSGGDRFAGVEKYTSYEVTVRLRGKELVYRAMALHHSQVEPNGKPNAEILDRVTSEMNTVLGDESPRVRSPWKKYIKSGLYLAVAWEIRKAEKAGRPLIPVDAPIGYLPGDEVGVTARDASKLTAAAPCVQCAIPTNFHQTGGNDAGGGVLHFVYAWDSSTGNLADLAQCTVGERVDYNPRDIPWPSPPFPAGHFPPNPTIGNVPATDGGVQDNHSTTGAFVKPYVASSFTATQVYRYTCPCANGGNPVSLIGFPYTIVRAVSQNADGTWKFTITKSGSSATINPLP